jgi:DNA-3-methyladenine glycosylase II
MHDVPCLDVPRLRDAVRRLMAADAELAAIVDRHGMPPLWPREPGFATLVRIIIEQQVSLSSAEAAFGRLEAAAGIVEPSAILGLGEGGMRGAGLTRQKARYIAELAAALGSGRLVLDSLTAADDDDVRRTLMAIPGIGRWTADVYLLLAMRRPDVWPAGDMALASSMRQVKRLAHRPSPLEMLQLGDAWRPWRAVAARLLWHSYLLGDAGRPS